MVLRVRAIAVASVETVIAEHWKTQRPIDTQIDRVRPLAIDYIDTLLPERDKRLHTAQRVVTKLTKELAMLLRAHYAGAVPLSQLQSEQDRIAAALAVASRDLEQHQMSREHRACGLDRALELLRDPHQAYASSGSVGRRAMDQEVFDRFYIHDGEITDGQLAQLFERLLAPAPKDWTTSSHRSSWRPDLGEDLPKHRKLELALR